MPAYRYPDGTITDVDPMRSFLRRARRDRDAGVPGWQDWVHMALKARRRQGGLLPEISEQEQSQIAAQVGFHVDPAKRFDPSLAKDRDREIAAQKAAA